eukprot:gene9514-12421_t
MGADRKYVHPPNPRRKATQPIPEGADPPRPSASESLTRQVSLGNSSSSFPNQTPPGVGAGVDAGVTACGGGGGIHAHSMSAVRSHSEEVYSSMEPVHLIQGEEAHPEAPLSISEEQSNGGRRLSSARSSLLMSGDSLRISRDGSRAADPVSARAKAVMAAATAIAENADIRVGLINRGVSGRRQSESGGPRAQQAIVESGASGVGQPRPIWLQQVALRASVNRIAFLAAGCAPSLAADGKKLPPGAQRLLEECSAVYWQLLRPCYIRQLLDMVERVRTFVQQRQQMNLSRGRVSEGGRMRGGFNEGGSSPQQHEHGGEGGASVGVASVGDASVGVASVGDASVGVASQTAPSEPTLQSLPQPFSAEALVAAAWHAAAYGLMHRTPTLLSASPHSADAQQQSSSALGKAPLISNCGMGFGWLGHEFLTAWEGQYHKMQPERVPFTSE